MDSIRKLNTLTFPAFVFILLLDTSNNAKEDTAAMGEMGLDV